MIQASGVNKEWYKFAEESLPAEKLKLVFNHDKEPDINREKTLARIRETVELLQTTKRKYQHIEVRDTAFNGLVDFSPMFKAAKWKSVMLSQCGFRNHEAMSGILDAINVSVQVLTINGGSLGMDFQTPRNFPYRAFPSLVELDCNLPLSCYFQDCSSLIKLKIPSKAEDRPALRKMLSQNNNLKDLAVGVMAVVEPSSEFKFRLQKLWITDETLFISNEQLHSFLVTQAKSLEILQIDILVNEMCKEFISDCLKSLKSLTFG